MKRLAPTRCETRSEVLDERGRDVVGRPPLFTIFACTPTDTGWIAGYMQTIPALVAKHGGRYLYQTGEYDRIEGMENRPGFLILIEWPDKKAAEAFYDDPAYQPHKRARQSGAVTELFLIPSGP